jgi:hypothetical protein
MIMLIITELGETKKELDFNRRISTGYHFSILSRQNYYNDLYFKIRLVNYCLWPAPWSSSFPKGIVEYGRRTVNLLSVDM